MRKILTIRFTILAITALAALLILRSSMKSQSPAKERIEDCCKKECNNPVDNNMIWDTFSRQFISICF